MSSPKHLARTAGLFHLAVAVFGAYAFGFVRAKVYAPSDAATTAGTAAAGRAV